MPQQMTPSRYRLRCDLTRHSTSGCSPEANSPLSPFPHFLLRHRNVRATCVSATAKSSRNSLWAKQRRFRPSRTWILSALPKVCCRGDSRFANTFAPLSHYCAAVPKPTPSTPSSTPRECPTVSARNGTFSGSERKPRETRRICRSGCRRC